MIAPLFVDVSPWQPHPDWAALAALGAPWHGGIVKVSDGTTVNTTWFEKNWRAAREAGGDRYGIDWFRGGYHFLLFGVDPVKQAQTYLQAIKRAGDWAIGDLLPIVDVELGSAKHPNQHATAAQIVECTTAWAAYVRGETGRDVVLYGNGAMRDRGITGDTKIAGEMGCKYLHVPRYTSTLPKVIYERAGWLEEELLMWQYSNGTDSALLGYPKFPLGFGPCDVSALVHPGGLTWLRSQLWAERPD